uniref:PWWP domain-containing protein n=1 Tax=Octactis speculum TaxID=3111310 RepID=A0A7S2CLH6_9STRA
MTSLEDEANSANDMASDDESEDDVTELPEEEPDHDVTEVEEPSIEDMTSLNAADVDMSYAQDDLDDFLKLTSGPGSHIPETRNGWRLKLKETIKTEASYALLLYTLTDTARRRLPDIEHQANEATQLLNGNAPRAEGPMVSTRAAAVMIPSIGTQTMLWARVSGFPWWPARLHTALNPEFERVLKERSEVLIVFVGEAHKYHLPETSVAPFLGNDEDPHMPKQGKSPVTKKELQMAINTALSIIRTAPPAEEPVS